MMTMITMKTTPCMNIVFKQHYDSMTYMITHTPESGMHCVSVFFILRVQDLGFSLRMGIPPIPALWVSQA